MLGALFSSTLSVPPPHRPRRAPHALAHGAVLRRSNTSADAGLQCSDSCETEFQGCMVYNNFEYSVCRAELDSGVGRLAAEGCAPGCLDTARSVC